METLELKHAIPYLNYDLMFIDKETKEIFKMIGITKHIGIVLVNERGCGVVFNEHKPLLKPPYSIFWGDNNIKIEGCTIGENSLMDKLFEKYLNINGFKQEPIFITQFREIIEELDEPKGYDKLPHWLYQDLIKNHVDIFRLIEQDLAINYFDIYSDGIDKKTL